MYIILFGFIDVFLQSYDTKSNIRSLTQKFFVHRVFDFEATIRDNICAI